MTAPSEISCQQVLERLWEYIDGELPPSTSEAVRLHLDRCPQCRREHEFHRAFVRFMRRLGGSGTTMPPPIKRRIFDSLFREETPESSN